MRLAKRFEESGRLELEVSLHHRHVEDMLQTI